MANWESKRNRFWEIGKSVGLAYFFIAKRGFIKGKIRKLICTNTWTRKFVAAQM